MATSIIEKIGLLMRQAESAGTTEEANTYTAKAQQLASQNQVDLAVARQAVAHREKREEPVTKTVRWGDLGTKNTKKHLVNLFSAVAGANDIRLNIYHDSTGVIMFGFPSDMEVTELLFGSLASQMVEAANAWLKTGEYKSEVERRAVYEYETDWYGRRERFFSHYADKPVDGRTARANFYQGFINKISSRLMQARRETLAHEVTLDSGTVTTGALVLADKTQEVATYYKATSNARGSWKGSSSGYSSSGHSAGSTAGSNARLSGARAIGGAKTGIAS